MPSRLKIVTSMNGRIVRPSQAKISVFDNALLYAEGLFEAFLAVDDQLVFLKEHLERLYRGARVTNLYPPVSRATLAEWLTKVARAHPDHVKKVRLTITSGESAHWTGVQGRQQVIITASSHTVPVEPFKLHVSEFRIDHDSIFRRIKTISYAIHAAALKKARKLGCDDALMLNEAGNIAEATSANIFWVRGRTVYTTPLSSGCLDGVTRRITLRQANRLGLTIKEKNAKLTDLLNADEVFISSSLKLVLGVGLIIEGRTKHKLPQGPVSRMLTEHYRAMVNL